MTLLLQQQQLRRSSMMNVLLMLLMLFVVSGHCSVAMAQVPNLANRGAPADTNPEHTPKSKTQSDMAAHLNHCMEQAMVGLVDSGHARQAAMPDHGLSAPLELTQAGHGHNDYAVDPHCVDGHCPQADTPLPSQTSKLAKADYDQADWYAAALVVAPPARAGPCNASTSHYRSAQFIPPALYTSLCVLRL